jgi:hypothetical protein
MRWDLRYVLNMFKICERVPTSDQYALYTFSFRCVNVSYVGRRLLLRPLFLPDDAFVYPLSIF